MRTAIYARVSTNKQDTGLEAQLLAARELCGKLGAAGGAVEFIDSNESGANESRPALDRLRVAVANGEFDRIVVYALSRLSRRVVQAHLLLQEFQSVGTKLVSCTETIDSDTPEGRLMFGMLAILNAYQRDELGRRTRAGLQNARSKGRILGRRRNDIDPGIIKCVREGEPIAQVSRRFGVSRGKLYRELRRSPAGPQTNVSGPSKDDSAHIDT